MVSKIFADSGLPPSQFYVGGENVYQAGILTGVAKWLGRHLGLIEIKRDLMSVSDKNGDGPTQQESLKAEGRTLLDDISCINKSFPEFLHVLKSITK